MCRNAKNNRGPGKDDVVDEVDVEVVVAEVDVEVVAVVVVVVVVGGKK